MIVILFYLISFFFIFNEIYYVFNKNRLDVSIKSSDKSFIRFDILYYIFRILFWIWMIIGMWSSQSILFSFLVTSHLIRFPFYHLNRKLYIIWDNILPSISIIFILIILAFKIIG
jgi:hypothetical protein